MRRTLWAVSLLLACHSRQQPTEILAAQVAAWNEGDLEQFMAAGYWNSPELSFYSAGGRQQGYEEVLERYRQAYQAGGAEMGQLEFSELSTMELGDDAALLRGRWELGFRDGSTRGGWFTLLLRRFPQGWRIIHDHTSETTAARP